MQRFIYNIILILGIFPVTVQAAEPVRIWKLAGLSNPESVVYDPASEALYVSNVNGAADAKDGNGFISRVSPSGEMLELNWVAGLDAPKGLALYNGRLYVADIDSLVEIDIAGAAISNTWTDSNAQFFNDVTAAADGRVFVSDMVTNRIHVLNNGSFSVWLEDAALENPNGLYAENGQLIVGAWGVMTDGFATEVPGHLKTVNLEDKSINSLGSGSPVGNLDGVEPVGSDFYVTDWMAGKLYRIDRAGNATLLLELEQGMADHEYMENDSVLVLPMMNNNTLLGYRVR